MEEEKHIYTPKELRRIAGWIAARRNFMRGGPLPNYNYKSPRAIAKLILGGLWAYFGFFPMMWLWLFCNQYSYPVFRYFSFNDHLKENVNMLCVAVSITIVVLACIGFSTVLCAFSASSEETNVEEWMENEVKRSEKICQATLQEANKEIEKLNKELRKCKRPRKQIPRL